MERILGLDIGTNSIGWAVVNKSKKGVVQNIEKLGSRIIPMSQDVMDKFGQGQTVSATAERTSYRGIRRIRERSLLRRERLHRVLHLLKFLPPHYDEAIGWDRNNYKTFGKFIDNQEVKLPWIQTDLGNQFIFNTSYIEMLADLKEHQPHLFETSNTPVPYDWTLYYLRKKALTQPISKYELAWIILNFNQKRGYYQLRGEEEKVNTSSRVEYHALKVVKTIIDPDDTSARPWYSVHLENGWIYRVQSNTHLDNWVGLIKEFIVTTSLNKDGSEKLNKEGEVRRSFRLPKEDDWTLVKKKTESDLEKSGLTVGAYIYDSLLKEPNQKVRGGLIATIERNYYKQELELILQTQCQFINELRDEQLYKAACNELYPNNYNHRNNLLQRDFIHLFIEDIIFYQRPLKTKKSLISNCPYEYRVFIKEGEKQIVPIKVIARSNPLFQEFRLWQFITNLKILKRQVVVGDSIEYDVDVTTEFLPNEQAYEALFNWLNNRKSIKQDVLFGTHFKIKKNKETNQYPYRWNMVEDREYPCNETRTVLLTQLKKCGQEDFIDKHENLMSLWHLLYSVEDRNELKGALIKFVNRYHLPTKLAEILLKTPPFVKEYGAYSEKAIKRFLPLMRRGSYWSKEAIDTKTQQRIQRIIDGEFDESITIRAREKLEHLRDITEFRGMPLWLAGYLVYSRHAESGEVTKWNTPDELQHYLTNEFKQHSLRNPVVEQIVLETLRTIKDLWTTYGKFSKIHLELGRDLKNSADTRKQISERQTKNEKTRHRILLLLKSLKEETCFAEINPYSPGQQEKMRIVEDGILRATESLPKEIEGISKKANPTAKELEKYRLWLDQKYISPYTGRPIPLAQLFTTKYEIEHIIPQSKFFDNSFSNKVICEAEVNRAKGNRLAHEFIITHGGSTITIGEKEVRILKNAEYVQLVDRFYSKNNTLKATKLLAEDVDELAQSFSERQLNDTRYINRVVQRLVSNIVRDTDEQESTSKHVLSCSGQVTNRLKSDWGLHDIWNRVIQPRFERLNELTESNDFGIWINSNRFQTRVPIELQKGFSKKRIDHRHHALDALVIACVTRNHVNYFSNLSAAKDTIRYDLRNTLCNKVYTTGDNYSYLCKKPWKTFTEDAYTELQHIVVSHKMNTRVLAKTNNYTQYITDNGNKELQKQVGDNHYAIRKPLHQETIFGRVSIRNIKKVNLKKALENWKSLIDQELKDKIRQLITLYKGYDADTVLNYFKDRDYSFKGTDIRRVEVYEYDHDCAAVRKPLTDALTVKQIEKITDESIRKILFTHLAQYDNKTKEAFSPEGLAEMNKNIQKLNGGKNHCPIYSARFYEAMGSKFALGTNHNNPQKFAIAAKGTNLYFGIYLDKNGKRSFDSTPLNVVIERLKNKQSPVPTEFKKGTELQFYLSPNDLVYVPTEQEVDNPELVDFSDLTIDQKRRIYKMVSCTGFQCHFLPHTLASIILNGKEFTSINKSERDLEGTMIKQNCWKLQVNRLGEIIDVKR